MDTYHAAHWSSDPFRLSSSEEEEEIHYISFLNIYAIEAKANPSIEILLMLDNYT
jgi:hypothetical protein